MRPLLAAVAITLLLSTGAKAQKKCTDDDAKHAEEEASSLKTWGQVYRSYQRFAQCDDAAIGEGYSSTIAHLMADEWSQIGQLGRLTSKDKSFETFILHHVDELMSLDQTRKIEENASTRCPAGANKLCRSIVTRLREIAP
jgi:hypothetical protein